MVPIPGLRNKEVCLMCRFTENIFDSLSRSFFMVILKKFSFGSGFLEWVEAVLKNQWLFAINSGRRKPYFKLEK